MNLVIMKKLTYRIFNSFNNFFIFFTYIRMSKDSSAKYYQNNNERLQKNALDAFRRKVTTEL